MAKPDKMIAMAKIGNISVIASADNTESKLNIRFIKTIKAIT